MMLITNWATAVRVSVYVLKVSNFSDFLVWTKCPHGHFRQDQMSVNGNWGSIIKRYVYSCVRAWLGHKLFLSSPTGPMSFTLKKKDYNLSKYHKLFSKNWAQSVIHMHATEGISWEGVRAFCDAQGLSFLHPE
jgi:hypothetical protein